MLKKIFTVFTLVCAIAMLLVMATTPTTVKAAETSDHGHLFWDPQVQVQAAESSGIWFCACAYTPENCRPCL